MDTYNNPAPSPAKEDAGTSDIDRAMPASLPNHAQHNSGFLNSVKLQATFKDHDDSSRVKSALQGSITVIVWAKQGCDFQSTPPAELHNRAFVSEGDARPFITELQRLGVAYRVAAMSVKCEVVL